MNIRRYITALLLLFGCIISMSAATVPDVRSVVRQDGTVVESTDYYPYGTPFTTTNSVQPYKYGAKELDRMHGLDLYDSQARWYDALTGRTSTLDPKAEKYYNLSPYTWCAGNPVKFIDPDGKDNYQVDILGNISLLEKNDNAKDILFSSISDGEKSAVSIEVDKSFIKSEKSGNIVQGSLTYGNAAARISTYQGGDAESVYKFMMDNTNVEWTLINKTYLGTCHDTGTDATASYLLNTIISKNEIIREIRHIHPSGTKVLSPGDISVAKDVQDLFPAAKLFIDIPSKFGGGEKQYDQYDNVGEFEEVVITAQLEQIK